jgi:hypothetical protein
MPPHGSQGTFTGLRRGLPVGQSPGIAAMIPSRRFFFLFKGRIFSHIGRNTASESIPATVDFPIEAADFHAVAALFAVPDSSSDELIMQNQSIADKGSLRCRKFGLKMGFHRPVDSYPMPG